MDKAIIQSQYQRQLAPLRVDVRRERDVVRVVPIGELDLATTSELERQLHELRDAGFRRIVLDLRQLEFMDSTGIRLIVSEDRYARRNGGYEFTLISGPPAIQRVLALCGVLEGRSLRPA